MFNIYFEFKLVFCSNDKLNIMKKPTYVQRLLWGQEGELKNADLVFLWGCGRWNTANTALSQAARFYPLEGSKDVSAGSIHQAGEGWNLNPGPEVFTFRPEDTFTAGPIKQSFTLLFCLLGVIPPDWGIMEFIIVVSGHLSWSQRGSCMVPLLIIIIAPPGAKWGLPCLGSFTAETSWNLEDFNTTAFLHERSDTEL